MKRPRDGREWKVPFDRRWSLPRPACTASLFVQENDTFAKLCLHWTCSENRVLPFRPRMEQTPCFLNSATSHGYVCKRSSQTGVRKGFHNPTVDMDWIAAGKNDDRKRRLHIVDLRLQAGCQIAPEAMCVVASVLSELQKTPSPCPRENLRRYERPCRGWAFFASMKNTEMFALSRVVLAAAPTGSEAGLSYVQLRTRQETKPNCFMHGRATCRTRLDRTTRAFQRRSVACRAAILFVRMTMFFPLCHRYYSSHQWHRTNVFLLGLLA
jgi:hypothetical protein